MPDQLLEGAGVFQSPPAGVLHSNRSSSVILYSQNSCILRVIGGNSAELIGMRGGSPDARAPK